MNGLFGRLALLAGVIAALLVLAAGPAHRFGILDWKTALGLLPYGVYAAIAAGAMGVVWLVFAIVGRSTTGLASLAIGLLLAAGAAFVPVSMRMTAASLPFIHDITTDVAKPPAFVALKPARDAADNGADYKTDPAEQQKGYPDIQPLIEPTVPRAQMFERAEATARAMGWEIVAAVPEEGRIEATDTTVWFGFKDDIVIRIQLEGEGSRLDIRSMSRVGTSDLGKNANRIRDFMARMQRVSA